MSNVTCAACRQRIVPKSGFGNGWRHIPELPDESQTKPYVYIDPQPKERAEPATPPIPRIPDGFLGC